MTPEQSEEEARRDEHLARIPSHSDLLSWDKTALVSYLDALRDAAAKPSEPPSPWPLRLPARGGVKLDVSRAADWLLLNAFAADGYEFAAIYLQRQQQRQLRNALVADASTAEKDDLLVALCEERGINLGLISAYAEGWLRRLHINQDETTWAIDIDTGGLPTLRAVLKNARRGADT